MSVTVAIVDDSRTMRRMLGYTLRDAGYDVVEAEDGQDALRVLGENLAHVVITDLNMPNMNGFELIQSLRAQDRYRSTPILMLTTEANKEKKETGRAVGATGWIVKPFKPETLLAVIKKVSANVAA